MKSFKICLSIMMLVVLAGCATSGTPKIKNTSVIEQIKKGVTRQGDVVMLLGDPQVKTKEKSGNEKWEYVYVRTELKGATFIPFVGLFAGGADSDVNTLEVFFDKKGIVDKVITGSGTVEVQNFQGAKTNIVKEEQ